MNYYSNACSLILRLKLRKTNIYASFFQRLLFHEGLFNQNSPLYAYCTHPGRLALPLTATGTIRFTRARCAEGMVAIVTSPETHRASCLAAAPLKRPSPCGPEEMRAQTEDMDLHSCVCVKGKDSPRFLLQVSGCAVSKGSITCWCLFHAFWSSFLMGGSYF